MTAPLRRPTRAFQGRESVLAPHSAASRCRSASIAARSSIAPGPPAAGVLLVHRLLADAERRGDVGPREAGDPRAVNERLLVALELTPQLRDGPQRLRRIAGRQGLEISHRGSTYIDQGVEST